MDDDLLIRSASPADGPAILRINRTASPGVTALDEADLEELFHLSVHFRVAEAAGDIVAYLAAFPPDAAYTGDEFVWFFERYSNFLYIDQVAVDPVYRRRGVASLLYRDLEHYAGEHGFGLLACEVNRRPANPASHRLHTKCGYREVGTLAVSDGRVVSLLIKNLETG